MDISFIKAKRKVGELWIIASVSIILLFFVKQLSGRFENITTEAWQWFLPYVLPTLSLMATVLALEASHNTNVSNSTNSTIDILYFKIAFWLSIIYFVLLLIVLFSYSPKTYYSKEENQIVPFTILDHFRSFNPVLITVQSVLNIFLGVFFSKSQ